jgi:hypothetical protein
MADVTISVPTDWVARVLAALRGTESWPGSDELGDMAFARQTVRRYYYKVTREWERQQAAEGAGQAAEDDVNQNLDLGDE